MVAAHYGNTEAQEKYYCNFGINPDYVETLKDKPLRVVGSDDEGEIRVMELSDHPFFVGTLFVPQSQSTLDSPHPLVTAFIRASAQTEQGSGDNATTSSDN